MTGAFFLLATLLATLFQIAMFFGVKKCHGTCEKRPFQGVLMGFECDVIFFFNNMVLTKVPYIKEIYANHPVFGNKSETLSPVKFRTATR